MGNQKILEHIYRAGYINACAKVEPSTSDVCSPHFKSIMDKAIKVVGALAGAQVAVCAAMQKDIDRGLETGEPFRVFPVGDAWHTSRMVELYTQPPAPAIPEGWTISRDGETIIVGYSDGSGYAARDNESVGISSCILHRLCSDILSAAPEGPDNG